MDESILHREDGPKMHPNVRWGKTRGTRSDGPTDDSRSRMAGNLVFKYDLSRKPVSLLLSFEEF